MADKKPMKKEDGSAKQRALLKEMHTALKSHVKRMEDHEKKMQDHHAKVTKAMGMKKAK